MSVPRTVVFRGRLPVPRADAWAWHTRPGAFERMAPPWAAPVVERAADELRDGARFVFRLPRVLPPRRWVAEIRDVRPGESFVDVQIAGPFAAWQHRHAFFAVDSTASEIEDRVTYALPFGALGDRLAGSFVRRELERLFVHRHAVLVRDLARHQRHHRRGHMKIAVTGASGMVGSALVAFLSAGGHTVLRLVRHEPGGSGERRWDPEGRHDDPAQLAGVDAVVHLAGENIGGGRWTAARKERIRSSRVDGTRALTSSLAKLPESQRPRTFVCASAIGYYGDRGDEILDEEAPRGRGFLADVVSAWEDACEPARAAGLRVVNLRFGVILSPTGGALQRMLLPFRLGLGGPLGHGRQWMSWVSLEDAVGVIHHALMTDSLAGPLNVVAPDVVRNKDFTKTLAAVLRRPAFLPMPAFAARLAFGEMADELLLGSARVDGSRAVESGYAFAHPDLPSALSALLGRASA